MTVRSTSSAAILISGLGAFWPLAGHAQEAVGPAAAPAPPHVAKRASHKVKPSKTAAKPAAEAPQPWAAVDPGRAGGAAPADPAAAATPGVAHPVQIDQDKLSYGLKWNSSNDAAGAFSHYSTQGVVNEINHDLGAPNALGTDAEVGMKLHF